MTSFDYLRYVRKVTAIFLLALLVVNFTGTYIFFAVRAIQIKREMRALLATLPDEELELIMLSPQEFEEARVEEHEIKVHGKMFDIARIAMKEDRVFVYGVYDEDEANMLSFIEAVLTNLQNDTVQSPPSFALFSILHCIAGVFSFDFRPGIDDILQNTLYTNIDYTICLTIESPPPRRT